MDGKCDLGTRFGQGLLEFFPLPLLKSCIFVQKNNAEILQNSRFQNRRQGISRGLSLRSWRFCWGSRATENSAKFREGGKHNPDDCS